MSWFDDEFELDRAGEIELERESGGDLEDLELNSSLLVFVLASCFMVMLVVVLVVVVLVACLWLPFACLLETPSEPDESDEEEEDEGPAVGKAPPVEATTASDVGLILLRKILLMLDTLGTLNLSQMPSFTSLSLISHAKIPGSLSLRPRMNRTTWGRRRRKNWFSNG